MLRKLLERHDPLGILGNDWIDEFWDHNWWSIALTGNQIERTNIHGEIENTKDGINIYFEVPGITRDNISILVSDAGMLKIEGKKSQEVTNKFTFRAKKYGFYQEYDLEKIGLDRDTVEASLDNGMLTISVKNKERKIADSKEKKIEIKYQ